MVFSQLGGLAFLGFVFFWFFVGFWLSVIFLLAVLGLSVKYYTETVPGYFARIVLNHLTGQQRTLFQGLNFKLPWETQTQEIDLKVELHEVVKNEDYSTKDGKMVVKYVYTIRPNYSPPYAGEKVILFASYEPDAIKMAGRACLSMSLSDYYGQHFCADLLKKAQINHDVFEVSPGKTLLEEFEERHGVDITVRVEDSDYDEDTQKARDTVARATALGEAVEKMTAKGVDPREAQKIAKMMQVPGAQEKIITFDAKSVDGLADLVKSWIGGKK